MASLRDVGQRLKQAREAHGLSLDEVSARTRVTVRHLLAIEEGNETDLPELFYVRGFLKKYAEAVGLSPNDVADAYRSAPIPTAAAADLRPGVGPIGYYLAIVVLLGGVLALAWHFQPRVSVVDGASPVPTDGALVQPGKGSPSPTAAPTAAPSPSEAPVAAGSPSAPAGSPSAPTASPSPAMSGAPSPAASSALAPASPAASATTQASPAASAPASPEATVAPATAAPASVAPSAAATTAATTAAASAAPSAPASPAASPSARPSARPGRVEVAITLVERSWVEAIVDGRRVYEGVLPRGAARTFRGRTVELSAGNAGGVSIKLDGKALGKLGPHAVVVTRTYKATPAAAPTP